MKSLLSAWKNVWTKLRPASRAARRRRKVETTLSIEQLEGRDLMSGNNPLEMIVDDGAAAYHEQGTGWSTGGLTGGYQGDYRYAAGASNSATWTFTGLTAGETYHVYTTWTPYSNRASNAPFTILDGSSTVGASLIDQRSAPNDVVAGGQAWEELGAFVSNSGSLTVCLNGTASGYVVADAIRILEALPSTPATPVDDGDAAYVETGAGWSAGTLPSGVGGDYRYQAAGDGSKQAEWRFDDLDPNKRYQVLTTWTTNANRASNAPYTVVVDGVAQPLVRKDQRSAANDVVLDGTPWESLGVYQASGGELRVRLSNQADGYVVADSVRLVEINDAFVAPAVLDDGGAYYTEFGSGWATGSLTGGYDGDYRYHTAGTGTASAAWDFQGLADGKYEVFTVWTANPNRASNATFSIKDGSTLRTTATVDQRQAPAGETIEGRVWKSLGTVVVSSGELTVSLSDQANGVVVADAVRIRKVVPPNTAPTTTGVPALSVDEDSGEHVVSATSYFADAQQASNTLHYSLQSVSAPSLFSSIAFDAGTGTLRFKSADNASGSANLTVRATDAGGLFIDSVWTVTVAGVADAPLLTTRDATGVVDELLLVPIAAELVDQDGSESLLVRVTGVPTTAGVKLSAGTNQGEGVWTLNGAELAGLTIQGLAVGDYTLTVTAEATEAGVAEPAVSEQTLVISVTDQAPELELSTYDSNETEDRPVDLLIWADAPQRADGAVLTVSIAGVPAGATLSAGTDLGGGTWKLAEADLDGLTLLGPENYGGDFDLTVVASLRDQNGVLLAEQTASLAVTIYAEADPALLTVADASGSWDAPIALDLSAALADVDGSETLVVYISGLPEGATLSAGVEEAGVWTLTPAQLAGLALIPTSPVGGRFDLQIQAATTEADGDFQVSATSIVVTIEGAPLPQVSITAATPATGEAGAPGKWIVHRTGSVLNDLVVGYYLLSDGTAKAGVDYVEPSGTVTILAGQADAEIFLTPTDDDLYEGNEWVAAAVAPSPEYEIAPSAAPAVIAILDDEQSVQVAAFTSTINENGGSTLLRVIRSGDPSAALVVHYTIDAGGATEGDDFVLRTLGTTTPLSGELTILAGQTYVDLELAALDDHLLEGSEKAVVRLAAGTGYQPAATNAAATVTLRDDERLPSISIAVVQGTAKEGGVSAVVKVSRTGALDEDLKVSLAAWKQSTATAGLDYEALPEFVVIQAGRSSASIVVNPIDDELVEGSENLRIGIVDGVGYVADEESRSVLVSIADDDRLPYVWIESEDVSASEAGDPASFFIRRDGKLEEALAVHILPQSYYGATQGYDYDLFVDGAWVAQQEVVIPAGASGVRVELHPRSDGLFEGDEPVEIYIGDGPAYQRSPTRAGYFAGEIIDDLPYVSIEAPAAVVEGGTSGKWTISRTGATDEPLRVELWFSGQAQRGEDYLVLDAAGEVLTSSTVLLGAGEASTWITVQTLEDDLLEPDENVQVSISYGEYRVDAQKGVAAASIVDVHSSVWMEVVDGVAGEGGDQATLRIHRGGDAASALVLRLDHAGGEDFVLKSTSGELLDGATLLLAAGESYLDVVVAAVEDDVFETDVQVTFTLVEGGGYTLAAGVPTSFNILLQDDEPRVWIEAVDQFARESGNEAEWRIHRRGDVSSSLAVEVYVFGSATRGEDYRLVDAEGEEVVGSTFVFAAGADEIIVGLHPLTDEDPNEGVETAGLALVGIDDPAWTIDHSLGSYAQVRLAEAVDQPPTPVVQPQYAGAQDSPVGLYGASLFDPDDEGATYTLTASVDHGVWTSSGPSGTVSGATLSATGSVPQLDQWLRRLTYLPAFHAVGEMLATFTVYAGDTATGAPLSIAQTTIQVTAAAGGFGTSLGLASEFDLAPVGDGMTAYGTVDLVGVGLAVRTATLRNANGAVVAQTTSQSSGAFRFVGVALAMGDNAFTVQFDDGFGNVLVSQKTIRRNVDSDHDGLADLFELQVLGTNPLSADSDGDQLSDDVEYGRGLNPLDPADASRDDDHDGVSNADEVVAGTNFGSFDTDGDGVDDATELDQHSDPNSASDSQPDPVGQDEIRVKLSAYGLYDPVTGEAKEMKVTVGDHSVSSSSAHWESRSFDFQADAKYDVDISGAGFDPLREAVLVSAGTSDVGFLLSLEGDYGGLPPGHSTTIKGSGNETTGNNESSSGDGESTVWIYGPGYLGHYTGTLTLVRIDADVEKADDSTDTSEATVGNVLIRNDDDDDHDGIVDNVDSYVAGGDDDLIAVVIHPVEGGVEGSYSLSADNGMRIWRDREKSQAYNPSDKIDLGGATVYLENVSGAGNLVASFTPTMKSKDGKTTYVGVPAVDRLRFYAPTVAAVDAIGREGKAADGSVDGAAFVISRGEFHTKGEVEFEYQVVDENGDPAEGLAEGTGAGTVVIHEGESSAIVRITPADDDEVQLDRRLTLKITVPATGQKHDGTVVWSAWTNQWTGVGAPFVTILDDDGLGGGLSANVDVEGTGELRATVSNGVVSLDAQDGAVSLVWSDDPNLPIYRQGTDSRPFIVVRSQMPEELAGKTISATLTIGAGFGGQTLQFDAPASKDAQGLYVFYADVSSLAAGRYDYDVVFSAEVDEARVTRTVRGAIDVLDRQHSPFGAGMSIAEVDRIVLDDGTGSRLTAVGAASEQGALLIRGDGSAGWYQSRINSDHVLIADREGGEGGEYHEILPDAYDHTPTSEVPAEVKAKDGTAHGGHGDGYRVVPAASPSMRATPEWKFTGMDDDSVFQLFTTWTPGPDRASYVGYEITGATRFGEEAHPEGGPILVSVDQRYTPGETSYDGANWHSLGFFRLTGDEGLSVRLTGAYSGIVVADAMMVVTAWTFETPDGSFSTLTFDAAPESGGGSGSEQTPPFHLADVHGGVADFDVDGRIADRIDRNGNRVEYQYDEKGRLGEIVRPGGLKAKYEYSEGENGTLESVKESWGREILFEVVNGWDSASAKATFKNADPATANEVIVHSFSMGNGGRLESYSDPNGRTTEIFYNDELNRAVQVRNSDFTEQQAQAAVPSGKTVSWTFVSQLASQFVDADTPLQTKSSGFASVEQPKVDRSQPLGSQLVGLAAVYVDERGHTWKYQTDRFGLLTANADPLGNVWESQRYKSGQIERLIAPAGGGGVANLGKQETVYLYDKFGDLKERHNPDGGEEKWTYDEKLHVVTSYTDPRKNTTTYKLFDDGTGNVEYVENALKEKTTFTYTAKPTTLDGLSGGLVLTTTDARGSKTKYDYIESGVKIGLVEKVTSAEGKDEQYVVSYEYDDRRNMTFEITPSEKGDVRTEYKYDGLDRVTKVIYSATEDHGAPEKSYTYYAGGQVHTATDVRGTVTTYILDDRNRAAKVTISAPDYESTDLVTTYKYDGVGNLIREERTSVEWAGGKAVTTYAYDDRNLLEMVALPEVSVADQTGLEALVEADGAASNLRRDTPKTKYEYDALGQVMRVYDARNADWSNPKYSTEYEYDEMGRVHVVKSPDPGSPDPDQPGDGSEHARQVTVYEYDKAGNLTTTAVVRTDRSPVLQGDSKFPTYRPKVVSDVSAILYDELDRPWKFVNADKSFRTVSYDEVGNLKTETDERNNTTTNRYDLLNRLIGTERYDDHALRNVTTAQTFDAAGNLKTATDELGRLTTYNYDKMGRLTSVDLPDLSEGENGVDPRYTYYRDGSVASERNEKGVEVSYEYDLWGRLAIKHMPAGEGHGAFDVKYTYDVNGNLKTVNDGTSADATVTYQYDDLGRILSIKDKVEDKNGNVVERTKEAYVYNVAGDVLSITNGEKETSAFEYDRLGRAVRIMTPDGNLSTRTYDAFGNVVITRDARGVFTYSGYDYAGRLVSEDVWLGLERDGFRLMEYDATGNLTKLVSGSDVKDGKYTHVTAFKYDSFNRVYESIDAENSKTKFEYYANGLKYKVIDGEDRTTTFTYDERDRLKTVVNGELETTKYVYDAVGNLKSVSATDPDPDGGAGKTAVVEEYEYDDLNRVKKQTISGAVTAYTYDEAGRVETVVLPGYKYGVHDKYTYDPAGRVLKKETIGKAGAVDQEPAEGAVDETLFTWAYSYDLNDQVVRSVDQVGETTKTEYDAMGRVKSVEEHTQTPDRKTRVGYGYDPSGNLQWITPTVAVAAGASVSAGAWYVYDGMNRRISSASTSPLGNQQFDKVTFEFNDAGELKKVVDVADTVRLGAKGSYEPIPAKEAETDRTTTYELDKVGRVVREIDPSNKVRSFEYDHANNVVERTDRDGEVTKYKYDDANRMETEIWVDQKTKFETEKYHYEYDALGKVLTAKDLVSGEQEVRSYDGAGRLKTVQDTASSTSKLGLITPATDYVYVYDANNGLLSLETSRQDDVFLPSSNFDETYQYDRLGRLTRVEHKEEDEDEDQDQVEGGWQPSVRIDSKWDDKGRLDSVVRTVRTVGSPSFSKNVETRFVYADSQSSVVRQLHNSVKDTSGKAYPGDPIPGDEYRPVSIVSYKYDVALRVTELGVKRFKVEADQGASERLDDKVVYKYDVNGRMSDNSTWNRWLASQPQNSTATMAQARDAAGRLIAQTSQRSSGGLTTTESFEYDGEGNLVKRTEGANVLIQDAILGTATVDVAGARSTFTRSEDGMRPNDWDISNSGHAAPGGSASQLYNDENRFAWAKWTITAEDAGDYRLFATWDPIDGAAQKQIVEITIGTAAATTLVVDQSKKPVGLVDSADGVSWARLGDVYKLNAGTTVTIRLLHYATGENAGKTIADAVRLERVSTVVENKWDARNRLVSEEEKVLVTGQTISMTEYQYDAFDRRTAKIETAYGSDGKRTLSKVTGYSYDASGLRNVYEKTVSYVDGVPDSAQVGSIGDWTEGYVYDPNTGNVAAQYQVAAGDFEAKVFWYLTDLQGTVRDVVAVGADGASSIESLSYTAYGEVSVYFNASGGAYFGNSVGLPYTHRFAYVGRELDHETGMQYHNARYYDPGLQQFISEDPLQFSGGSTNFYEYAGGSPGNLVDVSGRSPQVPAALAGAGIGLGLGVGTYLYNTPSSEWTWQDASARGLAGAVAGAYTGATLGVGLAIGLAGGAAGGLASGMIGDGLTAYNRHGNLREALTEGAIGGVKEAAASLLGAGVGAAAGRVSVGIFGMALKDCWAKTLSIAVDQVVSGTVEGGLSGAADGYLAKGTAAASWAGAQQGMLYGGLFSLAGGAVTVGMRGGCFAAGTPLLTPEGWKPIEAFAAGDLVLSRDETDLAAPLEARPVEELFIRMARILRLTVRGIEIQTTAEHPFFVLGHAWLPANELQAGDFLATHDGEWVRVDAVDATEAWGTVYNLRVHEDHTYFVGKDDWGFSVWAHNQYGPVRAMLENRAGLNEVQAHAAAIRIMDGYFREGVRGVQDLLRSRSLGIAQLQGNSKNVLHLRSQIEQRATQLEGDQFRFSNERPMAFEAGGRTFTQSGDYIVSGTSEYFHGSKTSSRPHDIGSAEIVQLIESNFRGLTESLGLGVKRSFGPQGNRTVTDLDVVTKVAIIQIASGPKHLGEPIRTATAAIRGTHLEGRPVISVTQAEVDSPLLQRPLPAGETRFATSSPLELLAYLRSLGAKFGS